MQPSLAAAASTADGHTPATPARASAAAAHETSREKQAWLSYRAVGAELDD